ncbi:hypothetical protein [Phormidium tenue]|jgi:hypothetical protein|uniref:Uncharacterized protein n=1 Tax=Phormidium tenue FACHB-1050 TaxID=2692857 RepID=A0ABR8CEJ9_9CYAN|nr:hypothetical protein [Phormidium tenue]MBD2319227.1 hypothetical protein [Phormidium tenue FACHB-1050]
MLEIEGRIVQFNVESQQGFIRAKGGKVYRFYAKSYRSLMPIVPGELVDFTIDCDDNVKNIYNALPNKCLELLTRIVWEH